MIALITLQRADGSWELSSELERLMGRDSFEPGHRVASAMPFMREFVRIWATALALAWLERRADHLRDEWRMPADKGHHWLMNAASDLGNAGRLVHEATRFI